MIFDQDEKIKFERTSEMCALKKEIISYLFDYMLRKSHNQWYQYKGEFKYQGKEYNLECACKYDNQMFTYKNLFIEHKQQVIDIDEMIRKGII